jgi:hypothetical protein
MNQFKQSGFIVQINSNPLGMLFFNIVLIKSGVKVFEKLNESRGLNQTDGELASRYINKIKKGGVK